MEVNGVLVDGVVVEKEKAKAVLEDERRHEGTAAIIEHTVGNLWKTHISKIKSQESKTIKVKFSDHLNILNSQYHYEIPFMATVLEEFSLEITVLNSPSEPHFFGPAWPTLRFQKRENSYYTSFSKTINIKKEKNFMMLKFGMDIPITSSPCKRVATSPSMALNIKNDRGQAIISSQITSKHNNLCYFSILDSPSLKNFAEKDSSASSIGIIWDCSMSRAKSDHEWEYKVITALLKVAKNCQVIILPFSDSWFYLH
eukprot:TRINITY_DN1682_c1_g2_i1.p1 TRINITY_DN1682_c1_g2~~TRINITY_DN1682_c1_g2_i1.p1  ORF type:complete len:256 (-),score=62.31 TRINITY_DN1682_c1_g2_i1:1019-1786(-)